jgi:DNA invertase Pin-like site-specific DNA recombinase
MTDYRYARVSTADQDYERQVEELQTAGATKIFTEKESGARAERPQLAKMMAALRPNDLVLITKVDGLGRSTRDLLNLVEDIQKAGANFRELRCWTPQRPTASSSSRF